MSDSNSRLSAGKAPQAALDALLGDGAGTNPIHRALWLEQLDSRLRPHLPAALAAHARLANIVGGKLVFLVDSPIWHAKLRLASQQLIDAARSLGLDATSVVVKTTRLAPPTPTRAATPATPMSASAREALHAALASLREPGTPPAKDES